MVLLDVYFKNVITGEADQTTVFKTHKTHIFKRKLDFVLFNNWQSFCTVLPPFRFNVLFICLLLI